MLEFKKKSTISFMRNKIFFDLDGTLIDSKKRLFELFKHLVPESELSFNQYWELKKNKKSHSYILSNYLAYSSDEISEFVRKWMELIEEPEWLVLDKPFEGVFDLLKDLNKDFDLFVVTARQSKMKVVSQISSLGWAKMFKDVLVTEQQFSKTELIKSKYVTTSEDWFVGDTGKDIQTGRELGVQTVAVLSGFMSKEYLLQYFPDLILESVVSSSFLFKSQNTGRYSL